MNDNTQQLKFYCIRVYPNPVALHNLICSVTVWSDVSTSFLFVNFTVFAHWQFFILDSELIRNRGNDDVKRRRFEVGDRIDHIARRLGLRAVFLQYSVIEITQDAHSVTMRGAGSVPRDT